MAKNWLDKYNDGGPVQENYNDAQTSYPPAFVGQGTFNGPMFNNGAVNGQFQKGGYVAPTMPDLRHPGGSDIQNRGFQKPIEPLVNKKQTQELEKKNKRNAEQIAKAQYLSPYNQPLGRDYEANRVQKIKDWGVENGYAVTDDGKLITDDAIHKFMESKVADQLWNNIVSPIGEGIGYATGAGETYQGLKTLANLGRLGVIKGLGKDALVNLFENKLTKSTLTKGLDKKLNQLGDLADYVNLDPLGLISQIGLPHLPSSDIKVGWKWDVNTSKYIPDISYDKLGVTANLADKSYNVLPNKAQLSGTSAFKELYKYEPNVLPKNIKAYVVNNDINNLQFFDHNTGRYIGSSQVTGIGPTYEESVEALKPKLLENKTSREFKQFIPPDYTDKGNSFLNGKPLPDITLFNDGKPYIPEEKYGGDISIPKKAMGGSIPGTPGFTYARTSSTPSKGPHRNQVDKTDASAQNGQEMSFYQHGLDWNPKMISKNGSVIKDDNGYWNPDNWGHPVEINSNNITMQGVHQPLLGISDTGHTQLMHPGEEYKFKGKKVTEFPIAQNGKNVREPIITNNPNDPRLKAHNDSLIAFNIAKKLQNTQNTVIAPWGIVNSPSNDNQLSDRDIKEISKINKNLKPINYTRYLYGVDINNKPIESTYPNYKKPVQRVVYQKEQQLNTPENWEKSIRDVEHKIGDPQQWTKKDYDELQNKLNDYKKWRETTPEGKAVHDSHNVPDEYVVPLPKHLGGNWKDGKIIGKENNLQVNPNTELIDRPLSKINTEQQPTNYSFHYPIEGTFDKGNPQGVKYFKDRNEWQKFLDDNDYNSAEEKNGIGQASGTLKKGRNGLRQEQKSLQNLDNLLNFTNYNTPQLGGWLDKYTQ